MARALYYAAIAAMAWTLIAGVVVQCERVLIQSQQPGAIAP